MDKMQLSAGSTGSEDDAAGSAGNDDDAAGPAKFRPWRAPRTSSPTTCCPAEAMRREGRTRSRRHRPVRAARPGCRRWIVWCRSAPAARCPFGLLKYGPRRLPQAPLRKLRMRLERTGAAGCVYSAGAAEDAACTWISTGGSWMP
jgi:hypothetical protein